nr:GDP-mannose 4,6-dehydratase [Alphaproteobacteria bacterium]
AHEKLGWSHKIGFEELVRDMVSSDMEVVAKEQRGDTD